MRLRLRNSFWGLCVSALMGCNGGVPDFELIEQDPKVVLDFSLVNGSNRLEIGDSFTDSKGFALTLKTMKFYLSNLRLISEAEETVTLSEIELIDLQHGSPYEHQFSYIVPKNTYEAIEMSIGLSSTSNSTDPTTVDSEHPLSLQSGMYWDWGSMYVFIMIEAGIDTNYDNSDDANIAFHTGLDSLYRADNSYALSFELDAFEKDTIHIDIDWNKLFHPTNGNQIDIGETPFFHANVDEEALEMSRMFTENFVAAISIRNNAQ